MTLVELLTVIAVIGITVSIGAGVLKAYQPNIRLYTASKNLRDGLAMARARSVAEQKTYGIRFVTGGQNQYELVLVLGTTQTLLTYPLPPGVTFSQVGPFAEDTVTFNKAGAPSESGTVVLQAENNDTRTVTINPSGYVHTD